MIKAVLALALVAASAEAATVKLASSSYFTGGNCQTAATLFSAYAYAQDGVCTVQGPAGAVMLNCTAGTLKTYAATSCSGTAAATAMVDGTCANLPLNVSSISSSCASVDTTSVATVLAYSDAACTTLALPQIFKADTCVVMPANMAFLKLAVSGSSVTVSQYAAAGCATAVASLVLNSTSCQAYTTTIVATGTPVNSTVYLRAYPGAYFGGSSTPTNAPSSGFVAKASAAVVAAAAAALSALVF